jgi:magnesium-transporting ATPase (P-type)
MITGDHLATARAIASQIGIQGPKANQPLMAITGAELAAVTDEELPEVAEQTSVFARVAPEQKLRLVRALQSKGHVVAMTGDGVNDAPALRHADIGVAMGRGGTEIAKSAAAMILTDDNFASIEAAVEEGRGVFDNLTKFIVWTLPTNVGEAVVLLAAILLGTQLPILPVQLLWINMMTAILLGLTLVFEPREPGIMDRPPRDHRQPLLSFELVMRTGLVSLIIGLGAFWVFHHETTVVGLDVAVARTAVVNVIVAVEIGYLWSCRSLLKSGLLMNPFSNRWVPAGILAMSLAQLALTYVPVMNKLFHTAPIPAVTWLHIGAVAFAAFAAVELEKLIRLRMGKR